ILNIRDPGKLKIFFLFFKKAILIIFISLLLLILILFWVFNNDLVTPYNNLTYVHHDSIGSPNELELIERLKGRLREVYIGVMLGDGTSNIFSSKTGICNFRVKQSIIHAEYFFYLFTLFINFCNTGPRLEKYFDKRYQKTYYSLIFQTLSYECFRELYDVFYNSSPVYNKRTGITHYRKVKIIPLSIRELLTDVALAFWIMDDGHYYNGGVFINTQSFTIAEVEILIEALNTRGPVPPPGTRGAPRPGILVYML